jgi:dihydrofolate reductase
MQKLRLNLSMSLDGFVAGPSQSVEHPLGVGGERLHEWAFELSFFRTMHGMEGGTVNESTAVAQRMMSGVGATIMGRNMFGGQPGPWDGVTPWNGWWGDDPPYHHPVFVLTHYPRDPLILRGGTTFFFITGGIRQALEQARDAAGERDITLGGGANAAQQFLREGLVDEVTITQVPVLLGEGERLFGGDADLMAGLAFTGSIAAPGVTHLLFSRT